MTPLQTDSPTSAVVILGMHRSGTSCLAGSLQQSGLHLGRVHESDPFNRKGNRENDRIMALNDAVLAHSGGRWDDAPRQLQWEPAHAAERDAIVDDLRGAGVPWGFKDPRTLLTLPFWEMALGPGPRYVGSFRDPARVVRSLRSRGGMSLDAGHALSLWRTYNERLLARHAQRAFPMVSFDLAESDYLSSLDALVRWLGLSPPPGEAFFERELRNETVREEDQVVVDEASRRLHDRLLDASNGAWAP